MATEEVKNTNPVHKEFQSLLIKISKIENSKKMRL